MADAVVVGGGPNGLVCATYLAQAGLRVTLVEARDEVGGGANGGVSCDHLVARGGSVVIDELRLAEHGLHFLEPDPCTLAVGWSEGTPWFLFPDPDRTLDGLAATHPDAVGQYSHYLRAARPAAELVLELANHVPTPGRMLRTLLERRARGAATLLAWSKRPAAVVLRSLFDSDDLAAPACVTGPAAWGLPPSAPGTGLAALGYALSHVGRVTRPVGGNAMVPKALQAALESAGGTVRTGSPVATVLAEGGRVRGVALADGEEIDAAVVVVACDPRRALVSWLRKPPVIARGMVERWQATRVRDGYASRIDAVVSGAAPPRVGVSDSLFRRLGVDEPAVATTVVHPGIDALVRNHWELGPGRVAWRPGLVLGVPSAFDASLRTGPEGDHILGMEVLWTPYALAGGWEASDEPRRWLGFLDKLCGPGTVDRVRTWRALTPPDYEREFGLLRGRTPSFPGGPLAALRARDPERSRYRTPVAGLYLTGADTFPGTLVWGAPGRNAAAVVLAGRSVGSPLVAA